MNLHLEIQRLVDAISPLDPLEKEHIAFTQKWIASGAELFRIAKPATPDPHLVCYFVLIDQTAKQTLLVDHKKAELWLAAGGHVEPNEHPRHTVEREIQEELGITADFLLPTPFFLTVTPTTGQTAGHTDVSLWYALRGCHSDLLEYDRGEFHKISWFSPADIPYHRTDPHMSRCIKKCSLLKLLD